MKTDFLRCLYVAVAAFMISVGVAAPLQALTIDSANSALDVGIGCDNSNFCFSQIFTAPTPSNAPVTGTVTRTGLTLDFSISLVSSVFNGTDGAVTSVEFTNVLYQGSATLQDNGGGNYTFANQTADFVSGTLTPTGAGLPVVFNLPDVLMQGQCDEVGISFTCNLTFGDTGGLMPISVNGQDRYFTHVLDINAVIPEPGTAILLGIGLFGLSTRRPLAS